jgi:hypothetical protein
MKQTFDRLPPVFWSLHTCPVALHSNGQPQP